MSDRHLTSEEQQLWERFTHDVERYGVEVSQADLSEWPEMLGESVTLLDSKQQSVLPIEAMRTKYSTVQDLQIGQNRGTNAATAKRIRRGQLTPEAILDLHGLTREEAKHAFIDFTQRSVEQAKRLVCVITGYGKMREEHGVLRAELPRWVNLPENRRFILSVDQARPQQGGAGAWMIYLKRKERL